MDVRDRTDAHVTGVCERLRQMTKVGANSCFEPIEPVKVSAFCTVTTIQYSLQLMVNAFIKKQLP